MQRSMAATPLLPRLGVVVNYFNPRGLAALRVQTELCALRALESSDTTLAVEVLVADGSGKTDEVLRDRLQELGIGYRASAEVLGFGQGYNLGLKAFAESANPPELLATCANDIFCDKPTLPLLAGALLTDPSVGCAIPYLSQSDYLTQNDWVYKKYREASSMTLNLNVFRTKDLAAIGYVPEALSGYYNDLAMMLELKRMGLKVVIINGGNVTHFGRSTTSASSLAAAERDRATFADLYPDAWIADTGLKAEVLAAGRLNRFWFYLQSRGPARWRRFLVELSRLSLQVQRFWHNLGDPIS